ncbi:MAG: InlB B-repeat-containing protein [Clostridia bacterium]|nr:InlB B-repeat-containing protein [Clostridia bacterium]
MKRIMSVIMAAFIITALLSVSVCAETKYPSPSDRDYYVVEVTVDGDEGGTVTVDVPTVPKGDTVKISAKPDDGYEFGGWTFEGDFDWIEGDANSPEIVIRPKSDVKFIAKFIGKGGGKKDTDKESPETGYDNSAAFVVMAALVVSASSVIVAGRKKYSKEK